MRTPFRTMQVACVLILLVFRFSWTTDLLAQSPAGGSQGHLVRMHVDVAPAIPANDRLPRLLPTPLPGVPGEAGAGLIITPTFDSSVDAATQTAINNAIIFYENTITTPISVSILFSNVSSGLGESETIEYQVDYADYRAKLASNALSSDDTVALLNIPSGLTNPVDGSSSLVLTSANGRAVGLGTPGAQFDSGSLCPGFTGDGCININVTLANQLGDLTTVIEHEMDEVLGLGSSLFKGGMESFPRPEDLFRWGSAGRIYGNNPSTTNPCSAGTPRAFLSFDGGITEINEFNNCDNGGDYGDWITHSPSQVQDAFARANADVLTSTSSELRALDVIGYTLRPATKKRRGQITSQ